MDKYPELYIASPATVMKLQGLDSITLNHSTRVAEIARLYERYMKYEDKLLSSAALLHDIGKLYISSKILDKPGVLSPLERDIINLHPYMSYELLRNDNVDIEVCLIALYHHGLNPPHLKSDSPPTHELINQVEDEQMRERIKDLSRVLHTIDSYEALTSDRPHRRGFNGEEALEIMSDDPNIHTNVVNFLKEANHLK